MWYIWCNIRGYHRRNRHLVSSCCLKCNKTLKTSYSSKMELRLTGTIRSDITWIKIYHVVGLPINRWEHGTTCWPPRSPDLTPCDFFLWGYIKDRVFIPPLPVSLNELNQGITTAFASVDEDMFRSVWTELDSRIDICRVTKGSQIENLWLRYINLKTRTTNPCKYFG
jgi:hypothetical protein